MLRRSAIPRRRFTLMRGRSSLATASHDSSEPVCTASGNGSRDDAAEPARGSPSLGPRAACHPDARTGRDRSRAGRPPRQGSPTLRCCQATQEIGTTP